MITTGLLLIRFEKRPRMSCSILEALKAALEHPIGLKLSAQTPFAAERIRRRAYALRDKARKRGDRSYDALSILLRSNQVWLVKATSPVAPQEDKFGIEALFSEELPPFIGVRGRAKLSLAQACAVLDELALGRRR